MQQDSTPKTRFIDRLPYKTIAAVVLTGVVCTASTATAATLITSAQIKDNTLVNRDIHAGTISENRLEGGLRAKLRVAGHAAKADVSTSGKDGAQGPKGDRGEKGATGDSKLDGAYEAVARYNAGDTNAGAIATVGCKDPSHTAISGGVRVTDPGKNTPVSSSFAGRMDWAANAPKPNRMDGWIVQFGGNAGPVSDKAPENVDVFALCVPNLHVDQVVTYQQSE